MLAVRQRAAGIAQRARQSAATKTPRQAKRSYASDHGHHDHHHQAHQVEESPGYALYATLGAFGAAFALYNVKAAVGEETSFSKWLDSYRASSQKTWLERNTLMTDLKEQAASDRLLFHSENKPHGFELRTPELFNSGCPNNVPAGHGVNLDKVVEHYRKQHLDEEDRKAKLLAEAKKA